MSRSGPLIAGEPVLLIDRKKRRYLIDLADGAPNAPESRPPDLVVLGAERGGDRGALALPIGLHQRRRGEAGHQLGEERRWGRRRPVGDVAEARELRRLETRGVEEAPDHRRDEDDRAHPLPGDGLDDRGGGKFWEEHMRPPGRGDREDPLPRAHMKEGAKVKLRRLVT